jgi:hypothetical protein
MFSASLLRKGLVLGWQRNTCQVSNKFHLILHNKGEKVAGRKDTPRSRSENCDYRGSLHLQLQTAEMSPGGREHSGYKTKSTERLFIISKFCFKI